MNVALAALIALASIAVMSTVGFRSAAHIGLILFIYFLIVIYFNGYLVPGTPTLTKRYFPRWLLAMFGKDAHPLSRDAFDPDTELRAAGLVLDGAEDIQLLPEFERSWRAVIDDIGTGDMALEGEIAQRLAALGGFDIDLLEFVDKSNAFQAWYDDELVANWESRAACIADIAAADIMPEYDSRWYDRPLAIQAELLGALRLFIARCPVCHGDVTLSQEVVSSCCYDYNVVATTCNGCNARLFEIETDGEIPATDS